MELTLPPELAAALVEQARQQGVTPEQLAFASLRRQLIADAKQHPTIVVRGTLADLLGDSIGILHSSAYTPGGARMSEAKGTALTEHLRKKRQQGRL